MLPALPRTRAPPLSGLGGVSESESWKDWEKKESVLEEVVERMES